jgi:hypothetical protein
MPVYQEFGLDADPVQLQQDAEDWMVAQAPAGFVIPVWLRWLLSAVARLAVEVVVLAGRVPLGIFQTWGQRVLGVQPLTATAAAGTVTFTLADALGHTVPAGAQLDVNGVGFETTADLVVAPGPTTGTVGIVALDAGSAGNGLQTPAELVSPTFVWVSSVALPAPTAGGTDGETDEEYANRLADTTPTLSRKAILIDDFAALARDDAEVYRALAVDNYDPGPPVVTTAEGHVSVFPQNSVGQPISSLAKARVLAKLTADRVLNLVPHVLDPTYTQIDVTWTAHAYPGYDTTAVRDAGNVAIAAFLDPTRWGNPAGGDEFAWIDEPTLRRNDLFGALYGVPGVRHVDTLQLAIHGGALGTADLTLNGPAALPQLAAGQPVGTVTL